MTPKSAWEDMEEYIPKDKVIWEAFYGNGKSGHHTKKRQFYSENKELKKGGCSFYTLYICYKIGLSKDVIFI